MRQVASICVARRSAEVSGLDRRLNLQELTHALDLLAGQAGAGAVEIKDDGGATIGRDVGEGEHADYDRG